MDKWYAGDYNDHVDTDQNHDRQTDIQLFYRNQFHREYKKDERALRDIIKNNITPVDPDQQVKLVIYHKNKKTSSLVMRNNPAPRQEKIKERNALSINLNALSRDAPMTILV